MTRPFSRFLVTASLLAALPALAGYDSGIPRSYVPNLMRASPDQYFEEMNQGWRDEQYASLKRKIDPRRSYIVLHNRLPSTPLDLRTPNGFRKSVMDAGIVNVPKLDIGHVMLGWHCEIDGKIYEGNTGITGEQENQQKKMANGGWGLTGLFSIFKDGHLQTPTLLGSVFRLARKERKPIATLAFEVEPQQCRQMLDFVQEFLRRENKPGHRFGLNADPLKFEGGGCGSFATATVSTSGAIGEFFPHLWRTLRANPSVFGYGLPGLPAEIDSYPVPKRFGPSHKVSALKTLLLANWDAGGRGGSVDIRLMDPELLFLAQETIFRASLDDVYRDNGATGRALMQSRYVRPRMLKQWSRPSSSDWESGNVGGESEVKIDAKLDALTASTVAGAREWFRKRKAQGYRARGFEFNGEPAVLVTR